MWVTVEYHLHICMKSRNLKENLNEILSLILIGVASSKCPYAAVQHGMECCNTVFQNNREQLSKILTIRKEKPSMSRHKSRKGIMRDTKSLIKNNLCFTNIK